jgi:hypothetical protein
MAADSHRATAANIPADKRFIVSILGLVIGLGLAVGFFVGFCHKLGNHYLKCKQPPKPHRTVGNIESPSELSMLPNLVVGTWQPIDEALTEAKAAAPIMTPDNRTYDLNE